MIGDEGVSVVVVVTVIIAVVLSFVLVWWCCTTREGVGESNGLNGGNDAAILGLCCNWTMSGAMDVLRMLIRTMLGLRCL